MRKLYLAHLDGLEELGRRGCLGARYERLSVSWHADERGELVVGCGGH